MTRGLVLLWGAEGETLCQWSTGEEPSHRWLWLGAFRIHSLLLALGSRATWSLETIYEVCTTLPETRQFFQSPVSLYLECLSIAETARLCLGRWRPTRAFGASAFRARDEVILSVLLLSSSIPAATPSSLPMNLFPDLKSVSCRS